MYVCVCVCVLFTGIDSWYVAIRELSGPKQKDPSAHSTDTGEDDDDDDDDVDGDDDADDNKDGGDVDDDGGGGGDVDDDEDPSIWSPSWLPI